MRNQIKRKLRLARSNKTRNASGVRARSASTIRSKDGYDTKQLGDNIKNSVDFTVIRTKLAKVKMNKLSSISNSGSSISRVSRTGKFRLSDGRGNKVS